MDSAKHFNSRANHECAYDGLPFAVRVLFHVEKHRLSPKQRHRNPSRVSGRRLNAVFFSKKFFEPLTSLLKRNLFFVILEEEALENCSLP